MSDKTIRHRAVAAAVLFQSKQVQSQKTEDEMPAHCQSFQPLSLKCTYEQWEHATPEQRKDYNERLEQAQRGGWLTDLDYENQRDDELTDNNRRWPES